jgi:hypothetical protein
MTGKKVNGLVLFVEFQPRRFEFLMKAAVPLADDPLRVWNTSLGLTTGVCDLSFRHLRPSA